jgi:uncharacterized membrane protein YvlD (DUF360 family)
MNDLPAAKIRMMKDSIRCLVFGLFGLMPVIGLPFALAALWVSGRARAQEKHFWNPARSCRIWGVVSAAIGAVIWSVVDTLLIFRAING